MRDPEHLGRMVRRQLRYLRKLPALVRAFFLAPGLLYVRPEVDATAGYQRPPQNLSQT